jgi:hypothetical protein
MGAAIAQLQSLGFSVVYIPYESIVIVFRRFGIDARFDEHSPDREVETKIAAYQQLDRSRRKRLASSLVQRHRRDLDRFFETLSAVILRRIERIVILALHGTPHEMTNIDDAIRFIESYHDDGRTKPIERYEIEIRYSNGDVISGNFRDRGDAVAFLTGYRPHGYVPARGNHAVLPTHSVDVGDPGPDKSGRGPGL